ncbi:MAG: hypothetical protein ACI8QC_002818 [Planctomycetota bacterium]|jgi:hypothetical protein
MTRSRYGLPVFSRWLAAVLGLWLVGALALSVQGARGGDPEQRTYATLAMGPVPATAGVGSDGCLACHQGIEDMHPAAKLSCVDCHGGDATATNKKLAHVAKPVSRRSDERVAPEKENLAWRRFRNPMDLRVAKATCASCHSGLVHDLELSLHGTTAGHLSDGFYEVGLNDEKTSRYGVFPRSAKPDERGDIERVISPPAFSGHGDGADLSDHFPDLVRKECMQCHLYSEGRAVRGRVGLDGDYRGEGCAACHVPYAIDGLSESADPTVRRNEPGHARTHSMVRAPATETCTSCHYGDASIGMHFRGLSQLPPGAVGGPDVPGTTDTLLNRAYYLSDPAITPPDVHHERGMHCVDCHTLGDVMGDGKLHGAMEDQVEISCEACHGSFKEYTQMVTERGTPLTQLVQQDGGIWLRSKVTGKLHPVTQVKDVIDADHADYSPDGAEAMTGKHEGLECYTCHAGWNVNFLGFHFYRNAALTQLDLISGLRTAGRVTTQEKVFATWKSFYAGRNENGKIAPYLTGFSSMGTVDDKDGNRILDQAMPVTASGLSGLTMVHHQLHSTRPTARSCVECHRAPGTWGLGTSNFRLARQMAFVADRRGIEVVALDRGNLAASIPLSKFVIADVVDIELDCDPLQGQVRFLYASEGGRGIHVLDVRDPLNVVRVGFVESISPRGMSLSGDHLYVADGVGGLRIFDVSEPSKIHRVGGVPMFDAHEVEVRWPHAYVADGAGGLAIVDVRAPIAPRVVGGVRIREGDRGMDDIIDLDLLFQYSRPTAKSSGGPSSIRTKARYLCAVLDGEQGLSLVDVTEPTAPFVIRKKGAPRSTSRGNRRVRYRGLALRSHVDLAAPESGTKTMERDYVYTLEERRLDNDDGRSSIQVIDVTDPLSPKVVGREGSGDQSEMLVHGSFYNTPNLQPLGFVPANDGLYVMDLSESKAPNPLGILGSLRNTYVIALEEFPMDRMLDPDGAPLKDVSHADSRWLRRAEIETVLGVKAQDLGLDYFSEEQSELPGASARAFFARFDEDRNGILVGKELERGAAPFDLNGDGRVILAEVGEGAAALEPEVLSSSGDEDSPAFLTSRVTEDGDLARLFDGLDPMPFDRNTDGGLDRKEAGKALFAALDLDGNGRLTLAELSRHPGRLRQLRYGDEASLELFGRQDLNRGGTVAPREFSMQDAEWKALDVDDNGLIQLLVSDIRADRRQGYVPPPVEWPTRRVRALALPPNLTKERFLAAFDRDEDGAVTPRELGRRKDLIAMLKARRVPAFQRGEIDRLLSYFQRSGVDALVDDFLGRWDMNGDGKVQPGELPEIARTLVRLRSLDR